MEKLTKEYPVKRRVGEDEATGFLALVAHYLVLGGKMIGAGIQAYLKNQVSLFYKSKLSDVRNNLSEQQILR